MGEAKSQYSNMQDLAQAPEAMMPQSNTSASRHRATKACPTTMTHYDDTQDVSMRPRGYKTADQDTVIASHLQIKATMERHKDALLDKLRDPTLTPEERSRIEAAKNEVKHDISAIRVWGSTEDYERMRRKYDRTKHRQF